MQNNNIERKFIDAVNEQIAVMNEERREYGLTTYLPRMKYLTGIDQGSKKLLLRLNQYEFPDNLPHRHLFFLKEFKENDKYVAFGENINYNNIYVVEKKSEKIICFSEDQDLLYYCADNLESFIEAFTVLIKLSIAISEKQKIDPVAIFNEVVKLAGGEKYKPFYEFIFPLGVVRNLNYN